MSTCRYIVISLKHNADSIRKVPTRIPRTDSTCTSWRSPWMDHGCWCTQTAVVSRTGVRPSGQRVPNGASGISSAVQQGPGLCPVSARRGCKHPDRRQVGVASWPHNLVFLQFLVIVIVIVQICIQLIFGIVIFNGNKIAFQDRACLLPTSQRYPLSAPQLPPQAHAAANAPSMHQDGAINAPSMHQDGAINAPSMHQDQACVCLSSSSLLLGGGFLIPPL